MLRKNVKIDGKDVAFKASAAIPRIYRLKFGRDIFKDLIRLGNQIKKNEEKEADDESTGSSIPIEDLEMFENVAYTMAKHADPSIPDTIEEWLDEFNTFSIYQVLPEILKLWSLNTMTDVENKKKLGQHRGK